MLFIWQEVNTWSLAELSYIMNDCFFIRFGCQIIFPEKNYQFHDLDNVFEIDQSFYFLFSLSIYFVSHFFACTMVVN